MDELSERYGELLAGSYDCVDRIVLNAYFSLGHNPGGFRVWWRRLHGGKDLIVKPGRSRRYQVPPPAAHTIAGLLALRDQVIGPILAAVRSPRRGR